MGLLDWLQDKMNEKDEEYMYQIGVQDAQGGEEYCHPFGPATITHQDTTHLANAYDAGYKSGSEKK